MSWLTFFSGSDVIRQAVLLLKEMGAELWQHKKVFQGKCSSGQMGKVEHITRENGKGKSVAFQFMDTHFPSTANAFPFSLS